MIAPLDDVVQGCTVYLLGIPSLVNLVGSTVGQYGTIPWIFQEDFTAPEQVQTTVQGTSSAAVVVSDAGTWGVPNMNNTLENPRIRIDIWSDPPRDALKNITDPLEARTKAKQIFDCLNKYLHRPQGGAEQWGDVITTGCYRLGEPIYVPMKDSDYIVLATAYYGVLLITDTSMY